VQGFGNDGRSAALALFDAGCKVVAISDVSTGLYRPEGLDIAAIAEHLGHLPNGLLESYDAPGITRISNEALLETEVDLLVPAALEGQITGSNAHRVRAWAIVEGANGPVTAEADQILDAAGVIVVPDILANAGGVTVSYFEWVQAQQRYPWDMRAIEERLRRQMREAMREVAHTAGELDVGWRTAALSLSISRVATAGAARGIYP
jgi:glutamate dehydrogenase (NAD(P)+)